MWCDKDYIFQVLTHKPIYKLFLDLERQGLCEKIQEYVGLENPRKTDLSAWRNLVDLIEQSTREVTIGLLPSMLGAMILILALLRQFALPDMA